MPGFELRFTNLQLKSASSLENERSEILNSGNTQHVKDCSASQFPWFLVTNVTPHLASLLTEKGHKLKSTVLRKRDLKFWKALVSIVLQNTTANHVPGCF